MFCTEASNSKGETNPIRIEELYLSYISFFNPNIKFTTLRFSTIIPLGLPVVPEVKITYAKS